MSVSTDEYFESVKAALKTLDDLGHPDAIADHLGQLGIKGTPGSPSDCPIAKYVNMVCPGGVFRFYGCCWAAGESLVSQTENAVIVDGCGLTPLSNVAEFARRFDFDRDSYPGLRV
jgi:hypothetical protein